MKREKMKVMMMVAAMALGFISKAQDIVYSSGDFSMGDAVQMARTYNASLAISTYNSYEGYLITSDGKINGNNLGSLDNVVQFLSDTQTLTSTEMYTIKYYTMGTVEVVFKGNDKKYYLTPYVRKCMNKAIKNYLN